MSRCASSSTATHFTVTRGPTAAASPAPRPSSINGRRHDGAYDVATLSRAVKTAGAHSLVAT
jgi:hypothetical protein